GLRAGALRGGAVRARGRRMRARRWPAPTALAVALVVAVLAGACDTPPSVAPTPSAPPQPTATTTTYPLDTTVWYAGLVLTFGSATAVLDPRGGPVTIQLQLQNPGASDQPFDTPVELLVAGTSYEPARDSVLPSVPAGGTAQATLKFNVFGVRSADAAVIQIGAPGQHLGVVPFSAGNVGPVVLKPVSFGLSGSTTASDLRLVASGGLLRWDLPDWAEELPAGSAALVLTYAVTYTGTFSGGVPFTGDNIRLALPDGRVEEPRADGRSQSISAILPGQTLKGLFSRFEIPAGLGGTYALVLVENGKQGKVTFKLPG
ncbi:MAG TPA: hypothetical protein VET90_07145, partial [Candidatus Binatus sp.]|nr:hypothetical protein [Candidatus Binatus sp.]